VTLYVLLGIAAVGLQAIWIAVLRLGDLKAHAVEYIAAALGAGILYLVSTWVVLRLPSSRKLAGFIFGMGLLFRLTLLPLYPSLSDDLLRYRWEGKAQVAGVNPYTTKPNAPEMRGLRDETWPAVNGKEFTTMYPPLTELMFRAAYRIGSSVIAMKAPALLFDTAAAVLLMLLLGRLGLPASRVLIYYWCPLAVVEFAASGHNDSIAVFFLLATLLLYENHRPPLTLAALTASALAKLFGAFLAPVLIVREWRCLTSRAGRPLLWPLLIIAAVCWPFRSGLPDLVPAIAIASGHWRNNDSLFGIAEWATGSIATASWIYIAVVAGMSLYLAVKRVELPRAAYLLIGTILLCAANCFPWYLTWILPLQAIFVNPAWLLLTVTSSLAYQVLIGYQTTGLWHDSNFFRALEYVPVYALLIYGLRRRRLA
jgi:hypothetical protein